MEVTKEKMIRDGRVLGRGGGGDLETSWFPLKRNHCVSKEVNACIIGTWMMMMLDDDNDDEG